MRAFKVFIFGLLYGWFIKVAFDRIYRNHEREELRNENASLRDQIRSLEMQLQSKSLEAKSAQRERIAPQPAPVTAPAAPQAASQKDDLKAIKGIGPAIEKKLNTAGIQTFAALSRLSVAELEEILGTTRRLVQDEGSLIKQAKKLAGKK
jgi:predicted flap endonuclease-1-like 5' DNA nuclease